MLNYLLIVVGGLLSIESFSQIKKGAIFLGGDFGASTQKTQTNNLSPQKQFGFTVSPVIGKAVRDNLIAGIDLTYAYSKFDNVSSLQKIHAVGGGLFVRRYKNIGNSGFYIFLQGRLGYRYLQSRYETFGFPSGEDKVRNHTINIGFYPGVSYAVSKKLFLESGFNNILSLNYFTEKREIYNPSLTRVKSSGFNISSSLNNISNLYLGFRLILNK